MTGRGRQAASYTCNTYLLVYKVFVPTQRFLSKPPTKELTNLHLSTGSEVVTALAVRILCVNFDKLRLPPDIRLHRSYTHPASPLSFALFACFFRVSEIWNRASVSFGGFVLKLCELTRLFYCTVVCCSIRICESISPLQPVFPLTRVLRFILRSDIAWAALDPSGPTTKLCGCIRHYSEKPPTFSTVLWLCCSCLRKICCWNLFLGSRHF